MKLRNSKKAVKMTLGAIIGLVLVAIILFAFVGFTMRLWNVFGNKPEEATVNSFENLVYEINTLEENKEKIVPFYIQDDLYLRTDCETSLIEHGLGGFELLNDICICKLRCSDKRFIQDIITWIKKDKSQKVIIKDDFITDANKIRNLKLVRNKLGVTIYDCIGKGDDC